MYKKGGGIKKRGKESGGGNATVEVNSGRKLS